MSLIPFFGYDGFLGDLDSAAPHVHVRESDTAALVELEVPRFREADVTVKPDPETGVVTITGRRTDTYHHRDFEHFLFGQSQPSSFRRAVHFSTRHYDVSKTEWKLEFGVLTVTVPKVEQPKPVAIPADSTQGSTSRAVAVKTTPEEFHAVARAKWPPTVRREATADAVTYKCELPPTVTTDHIELTLNGRQLILAVNYQLETKTEHSTQSQAVTYSTTLGVPQGTTAEDIHTEYKEGVLTVHMKKHEAAAAIPVKTGAKI